MASVIDRVGRRGSSAARTNRSPRLGDAIIAGIATISDAILVSRNPRDFEKFGVRVLSYG
jgi:predicted nucleic acid-binding protein